MSITKAKILRTIESMEDDDAILVLDWLNNNFVIKNKKIGWDDIEEIEPDKFDLEMMVDIKINLDCKEFISEEELLARRIAKNKI